MKIKQPNKQIGFKIFITISAIIFFFTNFSIYSEEKKDDPKELEKQLEQAPDIEKAEILNEIAKAYHWDKDRQKTYQFAKSAMKFARRYNQEEQEAIALANKAHALRRIHKPKKALKNAGKALKLTERLKAKWAIIYVYDIVGFVYAHLSDYKTAIRIFEQLILMYQETGDVKEQSLKMHACASFYLAIGDKRSAFEKHKKAYQLYKLDGNHSRVAQMMEYMASWHNSNGNYDQALQLLNGAYIITKEKNLNFMAGRILNGLGKLYKAKKENEKALQYFKSSIERFEREDDNFWIAKELARIGSIYLEEEDLEKALKYFLDALTHHNNDRFSESVYLEITENLGKVYMQKEDYNEALVYFNKAMKVAKRSKNELEMAKHYHYIGKINFQLGKFGVAIKKFKNSLKLSTTCLDEQTTKQNYLLLSKIYNALKEKKKADAYYHLYEMIE